MASETEVIRSALGVTLKSVSLRDNGGIVDRQFVVQTTRSPEIWQFASMAEANARYLAEVSKCESRN